MMLREGPAVEDAGPGEASEVTHATAQPETLC